jgi:hypothetical protein
MPPGQQPGGGGRVPERVQRHVAQARVLERLLVPVAGDSGPVHRLAGGARLPASVVVAVHADGRHEHVVVGQVAGVKLGLAGVVIAEEPQ